MNDELAGMRSIPGGRSVNKGEFDMANELMSVAKSEIVVYQPDDTLRLDVALNNDTVWLNQQQMGELFGRERSVIAKHIRNAFSEGELNQEAVCAKFAQTASDGKTYQVDFYNLDVIISVGYRVKSVRGTQFRQWATRVLRDYMLKGLAYNTRMNQLEDKVDRRMAMQDGRIAALEKQVDYIVHTTLPSPEQVFVNGQFLDAHVELLKIVRLAKKRIVLVDNFIDERVFTLLAQRRDKVDCKIYSRSVNKRDVQLSAARYAQQYPAKPITLVQTGKSHDRFLIIDNTTWHIGSSPKDAGARIFALMKMELDPAVILALLP